MSTSEYEQDAGVPGLPDAGPAPGDDDHRVGLASGCPSS